MATFRNPSFAYMVQSSLKQSAAILQSTGCRFMLIGSVAAWVRGGPESSHDLDFAIKQEDLETVVQAFIQAGYEIEFPPENWLVKAWKRGGGEDADVMVDLIYSVSGMTIDDSVLDRADYLDVLAHPILVLSATDLMIMKLMSLREQHLNYTSIISTARAIREQIDWKELENRCKTSPYANAFFTMAKELAIYVKGQGVINDKLIHTQKSSKDENQSFQIRQDLQHKLLGKAFGSTNIQTKSEKNL